MTAPTAATIGVTSLPPKLVSAWAANDADAFGELFTENGSMILPGVFCKGRAEIVAFMKEAFTKQYRGTQVTGMPLSMEFFGDSLAVMITSGGVMAAGENKVAPKAQIRASWIVVPDVDGVWRLASYQNSPFHA